MGNMLCSVTNKPLPLETIEPKVDEEVVIKEEEVVIKEEEVVIKEEVIENVIEEVEEVEEVVIKEEVEEPIVKEEKAIQEVKEEKVIEEVVKDDSESSVSTIKDDMSSISSQEEPVKPKRGRKKKVI
jgi:hypothetical protein